jgi:hypothetical protein
MKKIVVKPIPPKNKVYTYLTEKIMFDGLLLEFVDVQGTRRFVPIDRLIHIEMDNECNDTHYISTGLSGEPE